MKMHGGECEKNINKAAERKISPQPAAGSQIFIFPAQTSGTL